jgi:hypothetical protein
MSLIEDQGYITRDCPNCGNSRNDFKKKVNSARPMENMKWDEAKGFFVGFRFRQPFFTYIECGKCSLLYCPTYFNQKQLDELYASMPDNLAGESEEVVGKTQRNYINYLPKMTESTKLLEIGSDIGLVTSEFVRKFKTSKVIVIEPNKDVHERFKKNIGEFSTEFEIYFDLRHVNKMENSDVVIGIHVFDHIINPIGYFKEIIELMSNKSCLLVIVHNEKSILRKLLRSKWPPFCPQHPHLFSPTTISNILQDLGLEEIKVYKTTNWFSLRHVIRLMGTILGIKLDFRFLDKANLPLKLGNMAVVAKIKR